LPSLALPDFCQVKVVGGDGFLLDSYNVSLVELGMVGRHMN
jgi:hypothetical protein